MDDALDRDAGVENTKASRKAKATGNGRKTPPSSSALSRGPIPETGETDSAGESYFHKPHLDEMTVGRTEKPVGRTPPPKPFSPLGGGDVGAADRGRTGAPASNGPQDRDLEGGAESPAKPVKRHRIGTGSYEDPADEKARKRKPGKTGRPGR